MRSSISYIEQNSFNMDNFSICSYQICEGLALGCRPVIKSPDTYKPQECVITLLCWRHRDHESVNYLSHVTLISYNL